MQTTVRKEEKKRMANLELLRCVAMMMVIVLHYLDKGNILPELAGETMSGAGIAAWLLESFCIVAVNVYMLISGYFLCTASYKISRLIKLYLQVWVYSVGAGILAVLTGIMPWQSVEIHDLLTMIFPVSMGHYWFITAYVFMYIFLPFIGDMLQKMTKRQMQIALGTLLLFCCVVKSVLPIRLEKDSLGYDGIWYLCMFITAAYIRRFGLPFLQKLKNSLLLYLCGCLAVFGLTMGLRTVYLMTGSFGRMIAMGLEYNHLLTYLASLGLFCIFLQKKPGEKTGGLVCAIAPYTLGVYLLHENIGLRYAWQQWLGAGKIADSIPMLVLWTVIAVVVVFTVGILMDMLRARILNSIHSVLMKCRIYRKVTEWIALADLAFSKEHNSAGERGMI